MKETVKDLIKDSFPELSRKRIIFLSVGIGPFWGASLWPLPFLRLIIVGRQSRNISQTALTGLLAHELSHQVIYKQGGWLKYIVRTPLIYIFLKRVIKAEERRVDELVMARGFGRHLYLLTQIIDQDPGHELVKRYYFTPEEIEDYCRKNGLRF